MEVKKREAEYLQEGCTGAVCPMCRKGCSGRTLTALGHHWHPEHFTCTICNEPLAGTFFEYDGQPFCAAHSRPSLPLCAECREPTSSNLVIFGRSYHPECVLCYACFRVVELGREVVYGWEGRMICDHCWGWLPADVQAKMGRENRKCTS